MDIYIYVMVWARLVSTTRSCSLSHSLDGPLSMESLLRLLLFSPDQLGAKKYIYTLSHKRNKMFTPPT